MSRCSPAARRSAPTWRGGVLGVAHARPSPRPASQQSNSARRIVLRFFTAFGPRVKPAMVVPRMFRSAQTGEPMPLFGDGDAVRTWTHVDDLIAAVLCAIDIPLEPGQAEVVNAAGCVLCGAEGGLALSS
ncbi:NAD-dependent epimerase/dehydratase family protein [Actinoallomurus acaciae]|uniref:NAD-dependent epimerase/dehydratase family protein n=1 Tax=Actinoallomurus acaciae TaxID=502577 RepID=A0ABV5Y7J3_9ACTN